jgi:hypothetical protein
MAIGQGFDRAVYQGMLRTLVPLGSNKVKRSPRGCQCHKYDEVSRKHPTNLKQASSSLFKLIIGVPIQASSWTTTTTQTEAPGTDRELMACYMFENLASKMWMWTPTLTLCHIVNTQIAIRSLTDDSSGRFMSQSRIEGEGRS